MENTDAIQNIETSNIQRIAIKNLVKSPLNVRKKEGSGIAELAALIASQGLIQNLVVTEQKKKNKKTGKFEVVAGGRRLAALNLLVAEARLSKEDEVDCRVVGVEEALQMSLAENSGREAMHPADLIMAYRNLTERGTFAGRDCPTFWCFTPDREAIPEAHQRFPGNLQAVCRGRNELRADFRAGAYRGSRITGAHLEQYFGVAAQRLNLPALDYGNRNRHSAEPACQVRRSGGIRSGGRIDTARPVWERGRRLYTGRRTAGIACPGKLNQAVEAIEGEGHAWAQCHTTFDHADEAEFVRARTIRREPTSEEQAANGCA